MIEINEYIERHLQNYGIKENLSILDFGCGRGNYTIRAAQIVGENGKVYAIDEDKTKLNSDISINPSGGLKSKGHPIGATGVGQVVEVFDQLTGNAGARTVKDAKIGLTHNFGATGASCGRSAPGRDR